MKRLGGRTQLDKAEIAIVFHSSQKSFLRPFRSLAESQLQGELLQGLDMK